MQVEHRLAGSRLVELYDPDALGMKGLLRGFGNLLHGRHQPHERRWVGIENVAGRHFGITSVCPSACGITSMKASVCSSS
jgi:hypothetical protein